MRSISSHNFASDNAKQRTTIVGCKERDIVCANILISRWRPLLRFGEIDPELESMEETAANN